MSWGGRLTRIFYSVAVRFSFGSTNNQATAPMSANAADTRKEALHPSRAAMTGVREAVAAPPICAPMFMIPDITPD